MLIGPRGGGKTTAATWFVQDRKETDPDIPRISNVPIEDAIYVPDVLKFLAIKLIVEGETIQFSYNEDGTVHLLPVQKHRVEMLVIIDEAAISGLESRGSGIYPIQTYLLALSRKLHVDIILISQLMSMIDKRGQWLADFFWLCKCIRNSAEKILYFEYKIYNEDYKRTRRYILSGQDAEANLFGKFDSDDIPNFTILKNAMQREFRITDEDIAAYKEIANFKNYREQISAKFQTLIRNRDEWFARRWVPSWEMAA